MGTQILNPYNVKWIESIECQCMKLQVRMLKKMAKDGGERQMALWESFVSQVVWELYYLTWFRFVMHLINAYCTL